MAWAVASSLTSPAAAHSQPHPRSEARHHARHQQAGRWRRLEARRSGRDEAGNVAFGDASRPVWQAEAEGLTATAR